MPTDALDRGSPEPESSSSPSLSPSPGRAFPSLLVPGFGLAALRGTAATQPAGLDRFSPAAANPAIKHMEMMTRNYSDFMRSLAAKYNQNNAPDAIPLSQGNGFVRNFDSPFPFKGSSSPFFVRNLDAEGNLGSGLSCGLNRKADNQSSPTPAETRNSTNNNNLTSNVLNSIACGGLSDFSSSQTLLNLVRTASAQSASQLENYLKGAVKRSADGENRLDPLDLTVGTIKRPKLDSNIGLLQNEADASDCTMKTKTPWMTVMDKRLLSSPTSSTRTSPKMLNSERIQCTSLCIDKSCSSQSEASDLTQWTVEDVVKFVSSVETCSEYAEKFREESIDGTTLPLLTEDHLTQHMGLKLGPALKLRSTLAKRIGHCAVCMHCVHCHGEDTSESRRRESSRSPSLSK